MEIETSAAAEVRQFCESVSDGATKNLRLLSAIEQTISWLSWMQSRAKADAQFAATEAEKLKMVPRIKTIDADGTLCALFEELEENLNRLHSCLLKKKSLALEAPELNGDHKDSIVGEYTNAINAIGHLHNEIIELRWAVGEHDADLETPENIAFSTAKALKTYLAAL
jgi:hypothetical protein